MLKTRVITALALLAGFLFIVLLLPGPAVALAFAVLAALMAWEWARLMGFGGLGSLSFVILVLASCLAAYLGPATVFEFLWWASVVFWAVFGPLLLWRRPPVARFAVAGIVVGWLLIVPMWAAMVSLQAIDPWLLFAAMGLVWIADIAAYFAGRAWGRHKLAPAISPGKTWEGVAGAVVGVLLYGLIATRIAGYSPPAWPSWLLLLTALTAVSIAGDLFESLVKRQAGVKDSSMLLPGHGGFFDRLDSQTSTLPLAALILHSIRQP